MNSDPEKVSASEAAIMRRQVCVNLALRMSGAVLSPIDGMHLPRFAKDLIIEMLAAFNEQYPDGLPAPPDDQVIVAGFIRSTGAAFDYKLAEHFALEHP